MVLPRGQRRKNHRHGRLMTEIMLRGFCSQRRQTGVRMVSDCIRPIIAGTSQRKQAAKPLPEIGSR
jgi:hypothetical protein